MSTTLLGAKEAEQVRNEFDHGRRPLAFCDRDGQIHLPLDSIVTLARRFDASVPQGVNLYLVVLAFGLPAGG